MCTSFAPRVQTGRGKASPPLDPEEPSLSSLKQMPFFHCTIARLAAAHTFLMAEISGHALTDLSIFLWLCSFQTSGISMYIYVPLERKMKVLRTNLSALSCRHRGEPWDKQCAILNWKLCYSNCTNFRCSFIFGIFSGQWFHRNQKRHLNEKSTEWSRQHPRTPKFKQNRTLRDGSIPKF